MDTVIDKLRNINDQLLLLDDKDNVEFILAATEYISQINYIIDQLHSKIETFE